MNSLKTVYSEMIQPLSDEKILAGLDGLSKLQKVFFNLNELIPSYMLKPAMEFHYGSIETNGTGGAAFRKMYYQFLKETGEETGNEIIKNAGNELKPAVAAWENLALAQKHLSAEKDVLKDKVLCKKALEHAGILAGVVYQKENDFYTYIETSFK